MHPTSIGELNLFGEYTPRFMALVEAQLAIKGFYPDNAPTGWVPDFEPTKKFLDGKLRPYVEDIEKLDKKDRQAAKKATKELRHGLKIAINIVYGLTSAKFDNPFKDIRNIDNIVAKRGALFMMNLMSYIEGILKLSVVHIKTDSVKVPGAQDEDIRKIKDFAAKYGYDMEHEATYAKLGLVNDAVYVAKKDECITNCWTATGTQYQHPYVFKKLFGYDDDINFNDLCETKSVQLGALHLDFGLHEGSTTISDDGPPAGWIDGAVAHAKALKKQGASEEEQAIPMAEALKHLIHIGKTGRFTPVKEGYGGGQLWRIKEGKAYAVSGTKGHLWVDSNVAMDLPDEAIDMDFFDNLVTEAVNNLASFVEDSDFSSVEEFIS
jgi:hypothetical protein